MSKVKIFDDLRSIYTAQTTLGELHIDNSKVCYTLQDTVRPYGIKVKGHTAIPEGLYMMGVTYSNRFKRDMIMLYTEENGYELKQNGISFKGIRVHGGNTHKNTEGCPLVAFNKINDYTIQGTAEKKVLELYENFVSQGYTCLWKVTNVN